MGCSSSSAFKALAEATRSNNQKVCFSSFRSSLVENGYFSLLDRVSNQFLTSCSWMNFPLSSVAKNSLKSKA